jgi:hypothetical protein
MVLTVFWKKSHGPHLCQLATESETTWKSNTSNIENKNNIFTICMNPENNTYANNW